MVVYVALLRAINVAGRGKLPMARLRELCADLGATDVRTYVQSGNAVFASAEPPAALRAALEESVSAELGEPATAIIRSAAELRAVHDGNPFLATGAQVGELYASFLSEAPPAGAVASLDPDRGAPDAFRIVGDTVYLHLPTGAGRTKLTNTWFERCLGVAATARNWRTVSALVDLCG